MDLFDLTGKVALVTGASRGLGREMARALALAGADLAIAARSGSRLQELADEVTAMGRRALVLAEDLSDPDTPERLVSATCNHFDRLDILVTSAATQVRKPALEVSQDDWDHLININLRSVYFLNQAAGRFMIQQGFGKIINVASLTSVVGWRDVSVYAASKGGVAQLTKTLALEWAEYGVNVNAIGPGTFHTELTDELYRDPKRSQQLIKRIPFGRAGLPKDLAGVTVFLASPASDYITGQVIFVDGGFLVS